MHACVSCLLTYNSDRISQRQINRANQPATTPTDFYRRTIYLPLLDAVITDMQSRFSNETITNFNDLAYFIPAVIAQLTKVPVHLIDPLLRRYSAIIEPIYQFTLVGELALWRQKWSSQLSDRPDDVIPQTAAEGLAACGQQAFPLIHTFLTILYTLPASTARAERSFSTLRR